MSFVLEVRESFLKVLEAEVRAKAKECDKLELEWSMNRCKKADASHDLAMRVHGWMENVLLEMQEIYKHEMIMDL
jgi:hypothetical protein